MAAFESVNITSFTNEIESRGGWVLNFAGSARRRGVPDLLACVPIRGCGMFVAVEVKRAGLKATARQRVEMARIRRAGGVAFECDSIDQLREVLDAL